MYSSMHPLRGCVNRVERTLLNFFSRLCVRGGFFGALERRFAGDFEVSARCGWAVLPRNSGVFALDEGAAQRFSARRTVPGRLGGKIFKKGAKIEKLGCGRCRRGSRRTLYRVCGMIFGPGNETSSSVAGGALRAGASTTGAHDAVLEIRSSYIWRTRLQAPLLTL